MTTDARWRFQRWVPAGEFIATPVMLFRQEGSGQLAVVDQVPELHPFRSPSHCVVWRVLAVGDVSARG